MLAATLARSEPTRLLAIGCHADDIEIGCGGTILDLVARRPQLEVTWLVLSADDVRAGEARASAAAFLSGLETRPQIFVERFRDGFLPHDGIRVKERFEQLKAEVAPDVILTHTDTDRHQDHRLACELTWNTFRDHLILEYEVPKWDADLTAPSVYVPLSEEIVAQKIALLLEHFVTQRGKHWFTDDLFRALLRLRGMEVNASSGYAEAFHSRKLLLDV